MRDAAWGPRPRRDSADGRLQIPFQQAHEGARRRLESGMLLGKHVLQVALEEEEHAVAQLRTRRLAECDGRHPVRLRRGSQELDKEDLRHRGSKAGTQRRTARSRVGRFRVRGASERHRLCNETASFATARARGMAMSRRAGGRWRRLRATQMHAPPGMRSSGLRRPPPFSARRVGARGRRSGTKGAVVECQECGGCASLHLPKEDAPLGRRAPVDHFQHRDGHGAAAHQLRE